VVYNRNHKFLSIKEHFLIKPNLPGKVICTPLLGEQISLTSGLSIFLMLSVKGPVALMTHFAGVDQVLPKNIYNCHNVTNKVEKNYRSFHPYNLHHK